MMIAHHGGIHEIGILVVGVVLASVSLRWAEKRARTREADDEEERPVAGGEGLDNPA